LNQQTMADDAFPVDVCCTKLSGELISVRLSSDGSIKDVKRAIAEESVPSQPEFHVICQKLTCRDTMLRDEDYLRDICESPAHGTSARLDVTLLINAEDGILATFGEGTEDNPSPVEYAVKVAAALQVSSEKVLDALLRCAFWSLGPLMCQVEAASTLSSLVQAGCEAAVDPLVLCLLCKTPRIRDVAISGLCASLDWPFVTDKLIKSFEVGYEGEKKEYDDAWYSYSAREIAHRMLMKRLPAAEALGHMSSGDEGSKKVLKMLFDINDMYEEANDARTLQIVLTSLGHVAWTSRSLSRRTILQFIRFCVWSGRAGAPVDKPSVVATRMLSRAGSQLSLPEDTVDYLISLLLDAGQSDPRICTTKGQSDPRICITKGGKPKPAIVRKAAAELLCSCANNLLERVLPLLQHPWEEVQTAAINVLGRKAPGNASLAAKLVEFLGSNRSAIARAAVTSLGHLAKSGVDVTAAISSCLTHQDDGVRIRAPGALREAGGPGVVAELEHLAKTADSEVAVAALQALPLDPRFACQALQHEHPYVRSVAIKHLMKIYQMPRVYVGWRKSRVLPGVSEFLGGNFVRRQVYLQAPSDDTFAAVKQAASRRELTVAKDLCLCFLLATAVCLRNEAAADFLKSLAAENLWLPLHQAHEALALISNVMHEKKPRFEVTHRQTLRWKSSFLDHEGFWSPSMVQPFWSEYTVDSFNLDLSSIPAL